MKALLLKLPLYLLYILCSIGMGYLGMFFSLATMKGLHDGGLLGMVGGLIFMQLFFSLLLCQFRWYISLPTGLAIGFLSIFLAFVGQEQLIISRSNYLHHFQPWVVNLTPDGMRSNTLLEISFFLQYFLISILLYEGINYLGSKLGFPLSQS